MHYDFWRIFNAILAAGGSIGMTWSLISYWGTASPRTRMHIIGFDFILIGITGASIRNAIVGDRPPTFWTTFFTAGCLLVVMGYALAPEGLTQAEFEAKVAAKKKAKHH